MPVRCWNEKAGQTSSSVLVHHFTSQNFGVLSQGTYQLH